MPYLRCPSCFSAINVKAEDIEFARCRECNVDLYENYYAGWSLEAAKKFIRSENGRLQREYLRQKRLASAQPKSAQIYQNQSAGQVFETVSENREPYGVGGWLALLVIALIFLSPLSNYAGLLADHEIVEQEYRNSEIPIGMREILIIESLKTLDYIYFTVDLFISIFCGLLLLFCYRPIAVQFCIAGFFIRSIIIPIVAFYHLTNLDFVDSAAATAFGGEALLEVLGPSLFSSGIWTAYLLLSKRVRNTYYSPKVPTY